MLNARAIHSAASVMVDIDALLPHTARMCLLAQVTGWDSTRLRCRATSHREPNHPLARMGRLHAVSAVEYAAQAMALHGALAQQFSRKPKGAALLGLRDLRIHTSFIDALNEDLLLEVELLAGDAQAVIYRLAVSAGSQPILDGRATVMLHLE